MDPTGATPNSQSSGDGKMYIDLYGGPWDGYVMELPYAPGLDWVARNGPCRDADRVIVQEQTGIQISATASCRYLYVRRPSDGRFVYKEVQIIP